VRVGTQNVRAMKPIAMKSVMPVRAADEIRGAILSGALLPGTRIKQQELAARLCVSRQPVRKALLLLQREGLVSIEPGRIATVASLDRRFIADVYEFREVIDGPVAASVAKLSAPDLSHLDEIVARGREAVRLRSLRRLIELDIAFHSALYEAANNQVLIAVMRDQWNHIRRVMAMVLGETSYRNRVWDEHTAILQAIRSGKPRRARTVAAHHARAAGVMLLGSVASHDRVPIF
jgi:DNA-binding GntR family transcriptional regulator